MLIGAVGCNLAWGVIDAVLYLMGCLAHRRNELLILRAVRQTTDPQAAQRLLAEALPSALASVLQPAELEEMHQRLKQLPEPAAHAHWHKNDWLGAVGVFFLVFLCTFPVVVPFIAMNSATPALRVSNAIAILMLFAAGYAFGRSARLNPWLVGLSLVFLGIVLVALTIALGG